MIETPERPLAALFPSSPNASKLPAVNDAAMASAAADLTPRANTTISCIITNAKLTKPQALRVAQMGADAYATTIVPTHTSMDGDTIFCLASRQVPAEQDMVGLLAVQALSAAIVDACAKAKGAYGLPGAAGE